MVKNFSSGQANRDIQTLTTFLKIFLPRMFRCSHFGYSPKAQLWLTLAHMGASGPQQAKRALVKVLLTLAALYTLHLEVSRESSDAEVFKASKRVALKVHPDKGGLLHHAQELNLAKEAWGKARKPDTQLFIKLFGPAPLLPLESSIWGEVPPLPSPVAPRGRSNF